MNVSVEEQHQWSVRKILCRLPLLLQEPRYVGAMALLLYLTATQVFHLMHNMPPDVHGDVRLYHRTIQAVWDGQVPYRDFELEYPPYALVWFILPGLWDTIGGFQIAFGIELLVLDVILKGVLVWLAVKIANGARPFLPAILFALAGTFNEYFYLQRFDLIPAAITLAMAVAFWRQRYLLAGALLAFGTGCKLYPIIFLPPLLLLAWRRGRASSFAAGVGLGLLPLAILGVFVPWWRFLAFHQYRGLQVESFYASGIWFLKLLGMTRATWDEVKAWREVGGAMAATVLPVARALFLCAVAASVAFTTWRVRRLKDVSQPDLARLLLVPLSAFVAFNFVLSPQYLIWLAVLAAVAAMAGPLRNCLLLILAAIVIPVFFLASDYGHGFNLVETIVLIGRNLMLLVAWGGFLREIAADGFAGFVRPDEPGSAGLTADRLAPFGGCPS